MPIAIIHRFVWEGKEMSGTYQECAKLCGSYPSYLAKQMNRKNPDGHKTTMTEAMNMALQFSKTGKCKQIVPRNTDGARGKRENKFIAENLGLFSIWLGTGVSQDVLDRLKKGAKVSKVKGVW